MPENQKPSRDWIQWLVRNKLRGVSDPELTCVMTQRGFGESQISEVMAQVNASEIFWAATSIGRRVQNLETLLDVRLALNYQSAAALTIDRRCGVTKEDFLSTYYAQNRPVVLTDLLQTWPALKLWSPQYFADLIGDVVVDIQASRRSEPVYEVFLKGHTKRVTMKQFVNMLLAGGETNEYYLTANDRLLEKEGAKVLLKDFDPPQAILSSEADAGKQFFWFGPKGAVSPLHRDRLNVLMTQVFGRKRVKMIPAEALHRVYNFESFFSEVDCEKPDFDKFPMFKGLPVIDVELGPGDALFIPVGWWHHVRALEVSVNVSFTNFAFANDYEALYRNT